MKKITFLFLSLCMLSLSIKASESQTVACTAGELATLSSSFAATVTNLTVTGIIDARDFKTMRDDMPLLEVIDLSGTTVMEYNGSDGTYSYGDHTYPENEIPIYAFFKHSIPESKTTLKTFIFPNLITTINEGAFYGCSGLTGSLTIPNTVITIRKYAYTECTGFTGSLAIGNSVTSIGEYAFLNCSGFGETLTLGNSLTSIEAGAFFGCSGFKGDLIIPNLVSTIGIDAFTNCSGFAGTLSLGNSITSIGSYVFNYCYSLSGSLTIPSTVTTIDDYAFNYCMTLDGNLTIPNSVNSIGKRAFYACGFNGALTIPNSIVSIGQEAFSNCFQLASINVSRTDASEYLLGDDVFLNVNKTSCILYVPQGSFDSYKNAPQWQDFLNIVEVMPTSLTKSSKSFISIYPTVAYSTITISCSTDLINCKNAIIKIVDMSGKTVLHLDYEADINKQTINVSSLAKGTYIVELQSNNNRLVKHFIKE